MLSNKKYLRTFDNYANIKFKEDLKFDINNIIKVDIPTKKTLFVLKNVLTYSEVNNLIKKSEPHYKKLDDEYLIVERDSYRVLSNDTVFAKVLFERIKPYLTQKIKPCGFGVQGKWIPHKINQCFRFCKYISKSKGFKPHRDATYIENEDIRSILTVIIYLNDSDTCTTFYKTNTKRKIYQTVEDEMMGGFVERFKYKPEKGSILIFNHDMIHAGNPVIDEQNKYIIRSDIVYIRKHKDEEEIERKWLKNPYFIETIKLYREAFNQELDGNIEESSLLYKKALALRQFH